ncbi:hypothetical protein BDV29DRAFT_159831 [Aspergillus leporis]|jgi:NAD(P)-dependent dehydrogenase (short-subunit alcohol dehydrogenase family)|uniref:Oxidoreductase n=1 Tax=Aspergillus leporis TaxID=41062 RepID=A0A5N5WV73_9EURO|nr:hypothetical protein BDV29DRAFT_159831 [Aspergillus leporis]
MTEPTKSIEGLRIVIAGGASGVGASLAQRLARHGAKVIIGDINATAASNLAASITKSGGTATGLGFDFSQEQSIRALITTGAEAYGGIDGLVNMGADLRPETIGKDGSVLDMDAEVWRRTMDINLIGYALTTKHVLPRLLKQGGAIVNISSVAAWMPEPMWPAYGASKAGVHVLTRHTASSFGPQKVRANAVSLGVIATEPVKVAVREDPEYRRKFVDGSALKRPGELEEATSLVEYLISRESTFITGQTWGINGGVMMRE